MERAAPRVAASCSPYRRGGWLQAAKRRLDSSGRCGTTGAASFPTRGEWVLTDTQGCDLTGVFSSCVAGLLGAVFVVFMRCRLGWGGQDLRTSPERGLFLVSPSLAPPRLPRGAALSLCRRSDELPRRLAGLGRFGMVLKKIYPVFSLMTALNPPVATRGSANGEASASGPHRLETEVWGRLNDLPLEFSETQAPFRLNGHDNDPWQGEREREGGGEGGREEVQWTCSNASPQ